MMSRNIIRSSSFATSTAFKMKLLIVLSIIASGYADKLDRAYLPPANAGTAGGSPGALIAPGVSSESGFKQGLPSASGRQPLSSFGQPRPSTFGGVSGGQGDFGQGLPIASGRQPGTGSGQPRPSYGGVSGGAQNNIPGYESGIDKGSVLSSGSSAITPSGGSRPFNGANVPSGAVQGQSISSSFLPGDNAFNVGSQQRPQSSGSFNQGFRGASQGFDAGQAYKPERAQAVADRNAEILMNINKNNGDTYTYSYETSNGISAEESGDATNGVKAQGGFSYTGDDGKAYSLIYFADENGFQPQGEHLPTPHPIPEEILKSIEENARAAAAGTQEGAYRPEEYESEGSPQQYNTGSPFNRPQGQSQVSTQGSFPQTQSSQFSGNQGVFGAKPTNAQFSQIGQARPIQGSNQFVSGSAGTQENGQFQQGPGINNQGSFGQFPGQGTIGQGLGQISKGQTQGSSGYNYNQPQNNFGATQFGSGTSNLNRPQTDAQSQASSTSGTRNGQGTFGLETRPSSGIPSGTSQTSQLGQNFMNRPGSQPSNFESSFGQGQQNQVNKPSFPSPQSQIRPENQGLTTGSSAQGYQYQPNANRPSFGSNNRPSGLESQSSQSSQYKPSAKQPFIESNNGINQGTPQFGIGNAQIGRGPQFQQSVNRPASENIPSTLTSGIQNIGSGNPFGQANQPSFGLNVGSQGASQFRPGSQTFGSTPSVQGSFAPKGSNAIQAPYQYNRPSQAFPTQQQRPGSQANIQSPGVSSSGTQGGQRPSTSFLGSQEKNGQSAGVNFPGAQAGQRPGGISPGSSVSQGINGKQPGISSTGYQGANGQRPDIISSGFTGVDVHSGPGAPGIQGISGQRPSSNLPGSKGQPNQGRPEQFGGPRQPPSFNSQEGYKY